MLNAFSKSMRRRYVKPIPIYRNVYILICFAEPVQLAYIVMVWIYLLFLDFWETRIYATPSVEMMRRAIAKMPMAALDEDPIWDADADAMMAKLCGLR